MKKILNNKHLFYFLITIIFVFLVFYYYFGIFHYGYLVPPGDDGLRHMTEAEHITETGFYKKFKGSIDPPLFHIILSSLTLISGQNIVDVTKIFAPFLAILSAFSIYFITRRYFNKKIALLSLILLIFISPQPFDIYEDGTYLNLISAEFFLIFLISLLPNLVKATKNQLYITVLIIIFTASVILSHSLSSIYLIFILSFLLIIFLYLKTKDKLKNSKYLLSIYLIPLLLIPFVWNFYFKFIYNKFLKLIGLVNPSANHADSDLFYSLPPAFNGYISTYSYTIILLGVAGTFLLLFSFIIKSNLFKIAMCCFTKYYKLINYNFDNNILLNNKNLEKIIILAWAIVLVACSRFSLFLLPSRFARDAIVPITMLSAVVIYIFLHYLCQNKKRSFALISFLLIIFLGFTISNKITDATQYHEQIRLQESDKNALRWIEDNTKPDDVFLVYPKTITQGSWGNYIELLTNRRGLDGSTCPPEDDYECDPIYNPNSQISIKYYQDNSIDYVYAGKKIMGEFVWKDLINWNYQTSLTNAQFLENVAEFYESEELGSIIIFKVNQYKLNNLTLNK